jgi:hypothetical protein
MGGAIQNPPFRFQRNSAFCFQKSRQAILFENKKSPGFSTQGF